MKKSLRLSLLITVIAAALLLFAFTALAVPAAPGSHADGVACKSHVGRLLTLSQVTETAAGRNGGPMRAPSLDPVTSDVPMAVIVIGFSNQPYRTDFDWAQEIFRADRSLAEYYSDMSFGKFTFTPVRETSAYRVGGNTNTADVANDGVIHVTLSTAHDDWTLEYPYMSKKDIATNRSLQEALIKAVAAADAYIDFAAYDVNGDGAITTDELAVGFIVAGYEASSCVNDYPHGKGLYLWSHAYSFSEAKEEYNFDYAIPEADNVTVDSFIAISEQEDDGTQEPISTLAHELGHYLGLPDLYDTAYNTSLEWGKYDVSFLSVMAGGMYGTDPDTGKITPYSLDAWSRVILGWAEPEEAAAGDYTLTAQNYTNDAGYTLLRVPTQNPGEYYLLENRGFAKWDAGLADEYDRDAGGIILWHIDDNVYDAYNPDNTVNNTDHRPAVMPLYAEKTSAGAYAFTGKNKTVDLTAAFFDKTEWNTRYAALGTALDLPIYGTDSNADLRSGRTNSGILLTFLSDGAASMKVRVSPDGHVHNPVQQVVTAPTCTAAGTGYYECSLCGKRFTDATGTTETTGTVALPALGHTEPNAEGKCARCGAQLIAEENLCPYCHSYHSGPLGGFTAFVHKVLYFFAHLFGRM
ncbi:MAG: M6 family metalloprotease domain-containing protein [Clostridia bacterium]|nr:M6 family metalloprotease domain-containing protein [Clostridia bacterium]